MHPQARRKKYIDGFKPKPPAAFTRRDRLHELQGLPGASGGVVAAKPQLVHAAPPLRPAHQPRLTQKPGIPAAPAPQPKQPPQRISFEAPNPPKRSRRLWLRALLFPVAILFSLFASFLVQSQPLGIGALVIYGIVAWVRRVPSSYSFVMAVISLITALALLLTRPTIDLATNFSTYTFLLFVIGIISAVRESQSYPKRRNSKIPHLLRRKRSW